MIFGFGERAKLEKMGQHLKGHLLHEVILDFAESRFINKPQISFSADVCDKIADRIGNGEEMEVDKRVAKISEALDFLNLPREAADMYFSRVKYSSLKIAAESLYVIKATNTSKGFVDFFYNHFIREVGVENLFFFLFPQRSGSRYEDFNISTDLREAMLALFIKSIASRRDFVTMANHFAAMNPYFRDFPV